MALEDHVSICENMTCNMEYLFKPNIVPTKNTCFKCGSKLIHTPVTAEEKFLIERVSKDKDFFMAMLKLREDDIIEYKMKISQLREEAKKAGCYTSPTEKNKPKCPTCGSTNIQKISASAKLGGAMMFGIFSKTAKSQWKCRNCGGKW